MLIFFFPQKKSTRELFSSQKMRKLKKILRQEDN